MDRVLRIGLALSVLAFAFLSTRVVWADPAAQELSEDATQTAAPVIAGASVGGANPAEIGNSEPGLKTTEPGPGDPTTVPAITRLTSTTETPAAESTTNETTAAAAAFSSTTKPMTSSTSTSTTTPTTSSTSTSTTTPTTRPSGLSGVEVFPGDSIQGLVDAHPAGTVFVIRAGVHRNQLVNPKDGNTFVGEPGAVLSGQGVTEYAFGGSADGVTIRGLIVERYANPPHTPAIRDGGGATDWLVEDNEIRENLGIGLKAGAGWRVLRNFVHHNGQLGLAGSGAGILVEGNEIAYNNTDGNNPYWEAGGSKWVYTNGLVVRDNYVHDNYGPGLWTDINNIDTLYENNLVVDNDGPGIFHEISYDAIIRNNTVKRNGFKFTGGVDGAGILVANSPNVEVYGNTVVGNNDGIAGKHADRTKNQPAPPLYGSWELRNLYVHNNTIIMTVGHNGIVDYSGGTAAWDSWGNRFQDNTYQLGSNPKYYVWKGDQRTTQEWQAYEQDTNGTWR